MLDHPQLDEEKGPREPLDIMSIVLVSGEKFMAQLQTATLDVEKYPKDLIAEENRYKHEKFIKLNPPEKASGGLSKKSEHKEERVFSSDPVKDRIMRAYWKPLTDGFDTAIVNIDPYISSAHSYLTPLIQRYFDLEKGHFDWLGSDITRFERNFLIENFGVVLPRRVAKDESWETFVAKIDAHPKAKSPISVERLQTKLKLNPPLSLKSLPPDISSIAENEDSLMSPIDLIAKENQYKNDKFLKLHQGGAKGFFSDTQIFSSDQQKNKIMQDYWRYIKQGFEAAEVFRGKGGSVRQVAELYVIPIIQRYFDMQRGHFDRGGSSINTFERRYLLQYSLDIPEDVAKDESWQTFVDRIKAGGVFGVSAAFTTESLRAILLKPENLPLSQKKPSPLDADATFDRIPNGTGDVKRGESTDYSRSPTKGGTQIK